ncbi:cytochrome P450 [Streptomonospora arabica]|uniref:Cytochrome P450 n=1 Tax=Streptomonospora arabica TaxID=412417 RepID=A0ABV9SPM6_9ACTN
MGTVQTPVSEKRIPPGPQLPRVAQTALWFSNARRMLAQCHERFGDIFRIQIAHQGTCVFISAPEDVKRVFTAAPEQLHAGDGNRSMKPVLGENSVLLLDEAEHREQRRLLLPSFHGERARGYTGLMREIAAAEIGGWPRGRPHRVRAGMQAMTMEYILHAVFGVADAERLSPLRANLQRLLTIGADPRHALFLLVLGPDRLRRFPPFRREMDAIDRLLYAEIRRRRARHDLAERSDVLSLLLHARHEDGSPMTDAELRDELVTLLVAGHETTASALVSAVRELVRHPDKLDRLTEELRAGSDAYLKAVVYETLRLRPVISVIPRTLVRPMRFAGYDVPAGVRVVPAIYLLHRRPDVYPEPERFLPERFLEHPPGTYTWIPFGGGARRCLGRAFAQLEMETVLRELVLGAAIRPVPPKTARSSRRRSAAVPPHEAEVIVT